jgi:hypothetical protein
LATLHRDAVSAADAGRRKKSQAQLFLWTAARKSDIYIDDQLSDLYFCQAEVSKIEAFEKRGQTPFQTP